VQRAEHGGLYAQPMPCDHQQRTECGWHQGYPSVSDCYSLVGASCNRSCPSTRISRLCRRKPAPLLLHGNFVGLSIFFGAKYLYYQCLVILYWCAGTDI